MKRHFGLLIGIVLLSLMLIPPLAAQEDGPARVGLRPDAPTYALHGPYWVGTREFVIDDEERPLSLTIWYPAINPEGVTDLHTYTIDYGQPAPFTINGGALLDAEPDFSGGQYPLVIYSPSLWTSRVQFLYLTEHLASWGFVVMSADHPGSSLTEFPRSYDFKMVAQNPLDNLKVIAFADELTALGGTLEGLIDMAQIAILGYATGGTDALAGGGARLNLTAFEEWCADNPDGGLRGGLPSFCKFSWFNQFNQNSMAQLLGLDAAPEGMWQPISDPRVRAVIAHTVVEPMLFGEEGLASLTVPAMILYGTNETLTPSEYNTLLAYPNLGSAQKVLIALEDADSWVGFSACDMYPNFTESEFQVCSDPVWDMSRAHDLINHFTTAFLLSVLYGDADATAALAPDAVSFTGITYEATGF